LTKNFSQAVLFQTTSGFIFTTTIGMLIMLDGNHDMALPATAMECRLQLDVNGQCTFLLKTRGQSTNIMLLAMPHNIMGYFISGIY
jgi:hypothetical protein